MAPPLGCLGSECKQSNMADVMTVDFVKELSTLSREEGRSRLASSVLGWKQFCDLDLQKSIHLDYLYDNLMFCVDHGFAWSEVCLIYGLLTQLIESAAWRGITGALSLFKQQCDQLCQQVESNRLLTFIEFFVSTFFVHYRLYQFVFATMPPYRESISSRLILPVHGPPQPIPALCSGMEPVVWNYEQSLREIEQKEKDMKEIRRREAVLHELEDKEKLEAVDCCPERLGETVDSQAVLEIIRQVCAAHLTAASHTIEHSINEAMDDISFMLEKTALARPRTLGPPPRFAPRPVLSAPRGRSASVSGSGIIGKQTLTQQPQQQQQQQQPAATPRLLHHNNSRQ